LTAVEAATSPDSFLRVAPIRQYTRWHNQPYDRLLEQAARCTDQEERMRLYGQADRILIDEAVIMPHRAVDETSPFPEQRAANHNGMNHVWQSGLR